MSQQPPASPAAGSSIAPALAPSAKGVFGGMPGNGELNTDDVPTIISKTPPTQSYFGAGTSDTSLATSLRGRTLAHFELLEPIGVGGMAAVLRARDKQLDRIVALKILPPEMAVDPEHVLRFHQEARAAAKLDHENIARVYYCGEDQNLHFIAFEFVEGQNLRTLMERSGRLTVKDAVHYMLQIATGLAHAASRGVVHRDIKPSNIIIMPNGRAKLVDMGLARHLAPQDNRQLTQSGVTLGTFDYISPEQALEPRDADVRSDIYSLGCTFYHMLTGQPSVPEGTAAKKLHHHQHVAPIDPRQLNPEIPDEVAAILQRMMAKDARERYQRAEHLVQHLLQVAQKLGGAEVPDGVFFVDAPLASPPRQRPLVLATIAAALLAAFVVAVAVAPPPAITLPTPRAKSPTAQINEDSPGKGKRSNTPSNGFPGTDDVRSEADFAHVLAADRWLHVTLHRDIRFNDCVVFQGGSSRKQKLVFESVNPREPVTLRFSYEPESESPRSFWAGLTVDGGSMTFRYVNFIIGADDTPQELAAAIAVKSGQVVFDRCTFLQETPSDELIGHRNLIPVASVAAWNTTLQQPPVEFLHCYFPLGQAAVSIKGSARVKLDNCAFGPHACLFHLWGQEQDGADLDLSHVSGAVVHGPVFRLDDNTQCTLRASYSIFACPGSAASLDRPDFIRQTGVPRGLKFEGKRNAYYQLMSFWAKPGAGKDDVDAADWPKFKNRIAAAGGDDADSSLLNSNPWPQPSVGSADDFKTAFLIDPKMPELRQQHEKKNQPIGVEVCAWGQLYPDGLMALDAARPTDASFKPGPKDRLVDPSGVITGRRVYTKIESALSEADPDDVILIKHSGELKIEPTALTEKRVKLRPFDDKSQPLLVLGKTADKNGGLFQLHHSQIEFEQLEFLLRPESNQRSLAVVSMAGDSTCRFEKCVITLDNTESPNVDLDVVTLLDPRETIKTSSESKFPAEVRFKTCYVRGRGDLVGVRASRPFDLEVDTSLIWLAGSLLTVHPLGAETVPAAARCTVHLHKTTAYLTEPALHLSAGKMGKGLVVTQVEATACLFAAAAARPLARLEGLDNVNQLKKTLTWTGAGNAFVGFDRLLEQTGGDGGIALVYQSEEWKSFIDAGLDTRFDRAALQPAGGAEPPFTRSAPSDFPLKSELSSFGAPIDQLPRPAEIVGQDPLKNNGLTRR